MIKKVRMPHGEKLPWELMEEILYRVPPKSLVRFKTVSKKWNALFNDKSFLNNHKSIFRFILMTKSKIYSVSIDPEIVLRELTLDVPGLESQTHTKLVDCYEFLLCGMNHRDNAVWNPWLKQTRVIKSQSFLRVQGIGYDSHKRLHESCYKTIAWKGFYPFSNTCWKVHDFATDTWKDIANMKSESSDNNQISKQDTLNGKGVSLNGHMYWLSFYVETDPLYRVLEFDFSSESFLKTCDLPCLKKHPHDVLVLGNYNGDQLSLLKQCHITKKIEIWVTKEKISKGNDVVWKIFMEVSIPNLPDLVQIGYDSQPSYFIDDKKLVVCSCDETGRAWIYIMEANKLIKKVKLESIVDKWPKHCTYFPSLFSVPQGPRKEEAQLQV